MDRHPTPTENARTLTQLIEILELLHYTAQHRLITAVCIVFSIPPPPEPAPVESP